MPWFAFAFLTACLRAGEDLFSKQSLRYLPSYRVTLLLTGLTSLFLMPLVWLSGIPSIADHFLRTLLIGSSLNTFAFLVYTKAIQLGEFSLTIPLTTISPLLMFITSPLIVGEQPKLADFLGCLLIVLGSYILNWQAQQRSYWAPLIALWRLPGSRLMLLVAVLWSVTSNIDKIGVQASSPFFWVFCNYSVMALQILLLLGLGIIRGSQGWGFQALGQPHCWRFLLPMGVCSALAVASQMYAITLTLVVRVIAVKRLNALISVILGRVIFKETGLRQRLLGAILMVAGVVLLV